ncbi:MAG TPA: glycogen synthase [Candidatus Limnocylindria bacterium]|nr:glycogen synthase [Candidatus Limnocylindria bacterium]
MKALILTNEYPPNVYGGAGMHVAELTRALRGRIPVEVRTFGAQREDGESWRVAGYPPDERLPGGEDRLRPVWDAFGRCLRMAADPTDADVVHCHTWYTHLGGLLIQGGRGIPLVVTVHSLEPLRPWKREQLGGGYDLSSWVERTALEAADAVVAVSAGTREDVLHHFDVKPDRVTVIHNGIDADFFAPDPATETVERLGIDPSIPSVLFVGRITRQKGLVHLLHAIRDLDPEIGVVLAAGQPDTPELAAEVETLVKEARESRPNVVWIPEMLSRSEIRQLYSHAAVFACPSVYEPFGITNLEAMACATPVVASAVGGIPEVVADGETGVLVPVELSPAEPMTPVDPARFARDLAAAINALIGDPERRAAMGAAGRRRAAETFSWSSVADRTLDLYRTLVG